MILTRFGSGHGVLILLTWDELAVLLLLVVLEDTCEALVESSSASEPLPIEWMPEDLDLSFTVLLLLLLLLCSAVIEETDGTSGEGLRQTSSLGPTRMSVPGTYPLSGSPWGSSCIFPVGAGGMKRLRRGKPCLKMPVLLLFAAAEV